MSNPTPRSYKLKARTYLDYAATTPLDPRVEKAMQPFLREEFGNPSSIHAEGVAAKKALDNSRASVARALEAHADEIVFTSGGTESNNLAIHGVLSSLSSATENRYDRTYFLKGATLVSEDGGILPARANSSLKSDKPHVVTTNIEHASVLKPFRELERRGSIEVTYVPVEQDGVVKPEKIIAAIRPNTVLVSVMYANNEIGTVQPIRKISQLLAKCRAVKDKGLGIKDSRRKFPIFHSDACQAPLYLNCLVNALGVDLLSLDAHKIYGPKGVGALYVRREIPLAPLLFGGGQERGLRPTTENIPGIVGLAEALRLAIAERKRESERIAKLRDILYTNVLQNTAIDAVANGSMRRGERLPNNLNISLPGVDTEFLTLQLDARGIAVSTKSSCLKSEKSSYVVAALGGGKGHSLSSLRFTLGRKTTRKDLEIASSILLELLDP